MVHDPAAAKALTGGAVEMPHGEMPHLALFHCVPQRPIRHDSFVACVIQESDIHPGMKWVLDGEWQSQARPATLGDEILVYCTFFRRFLVKQGR